MEPNGPSRAPTNALELNRSQSLVKTRCSSISGMKSTNVNLRQRGNCMAYLTSQKGRELCMGTSLMMTVTLVVIGFTLLLSLHVTEIIVEYKDTSIFLGLLFSVSIIGIVIVVLLGHLGKLTTDEHYKDQSRTTFLRGGMTVLATGGIVYYAVELYTMVRNPAYCHQGHVLGQAVLAILFTIMQVVFLLKYSKVRINRHYVVATASRFLLMVIIATNSVVWLSVLMRETHEEITHNNVSTNEDSNGTSQNNTDGCTESISYIISPFSFPMLVEFCVVSSTMILAIWEKCDADTENSYKYLAIGTDSNCSLRQESRRHMSTVSSMDVSMSNCDDVMVRRSDFYNDKLGFLCGWFFLVIAIVFILIVFTFDNDDIARHWDYFINFILVVCGCITVPVSVLKMSGMRFKDEQIRRQRKGERHRRTKLRFHRKMDQNLLTVAFLALLTYKIMSLLVACYAGDGIMFADSVASIAHGFLQTAFLNWYACHKRAKTQREKNEKPGRQCLEYLRLLNLSLWLVNTFLLRETHAKTLHQETYGRETWAIISNILQPLTILYYFHSMVCIAQVMVRSYTSKYVGIPRQGLGDIIGDEEKRHSFGSLPDVFVDNVATDSVPGLRRNLSSPDLPTTCHFT